MGSWKSFQLPISISGISKLLIMKKIKFIFSLLVILATVQLSSCGKSDSPVNQIVEILDQATQKTEAISNAAELANVQNIISPDDIWKIIKENSDYELTKGDKEKLKKSYNKLVKTAYEKTSEYLPSEDTKKSIKSQLDLMMEAIDRNIDEATTLGNIRGMN